MHPMYPLFGIDWPHMIKTSLGEGRSTGAGLSGGGRSEASGPFGSRMRKKKVTFEYTLFSNA